MKIIQKLKTQVKIIAALSIALFGGITIWSCSQDELDESGQPVYRYTAEEIATLKTMAEEYGIPDVKFPTESNQHLNSMKEMEEIFKNIALIKSSISRPIETTQIAENQIIYKNKNIPFKRNLEPIAETLKSTTNTAYGTITWTVKWSQSVSTSTGRYTVPSVSVNASLSLSPMMEQNGFHVGASNTSSSIRGTELYVTFECEIMHYSSVTYVLTSSQWLHPGFRSYIR